MITNIQESSFLTEHLMSLALMGSQWVLWLLILLSFVSLTLIFDRCFFFWRTRSLDHRQFVEDLNKALLAEDWQGAKNLAYQKNTLPYKTALLAIEAKIRGMKSTEEKMGEFFIEEKLKLEKGFGFLGTLGNNAPFIGLFGTVLGIIQAFHDLSLNPQGGASMIMTGVYEALIATAVGLVVAIPAVIAYNGFQRISKRRLQQAQGIQKLVLSHFLSKME